METARRVSRRLRALAAQTLGRRAPAQPSAVAAAPNAPHPTSDGERDVVAKDFDPTYYLAAYPDIAAAGVDPLEHFLVTGWREGRNPNAWFSVRDYVEANPDLAEADLNPFTHYLRAGRAEGRTPRFELGFRYELIRSQTPATQQLDDALAALAAVVAEPEDRLVQGLRRATHGLRHVHLTFGHDDYTATYGGSQLCVRIEAERCAARGIDHLHLHPAEPCLFVRELGEPGPLRVLLNGEALGVFAAQSVAQALAQVRPAALGQASLAIHSLLGHAVDEVVAIAEGLGAPAAFFWLHDFASLCDGFQLLRNDVEYCAAPPIESAACGICIYGPLRRRQVDAHRRLFERLPLTLVSPSENALQFWRSAGAFPVAAAVVHPHAELQASGKAAPTNANRKLRVAYLGMPIAYKGWAAFDALARRLAGDGRYEFLHLGAYPDPTGLAQFHPVNAAQGAPDAMRATLADLAVDVALIWPLVRETFSFTAYEAVAAGAAVVTHPDSGNVAAFVRGLGAGLVIDDEAALAEAFVTGQVLSLARTQRRPDLAVLKYSGMTLDLVRGGA